MRTARQVGRMLPPQACGCGLWEHGYPPLRGQVIHSEERVGWNEREEGWNER